MTETFKVMEEPCVFCGKPGWIRMSPEETVACRLCYHTKRVETSTGHWKAHHEYMVTYLGEQNEATCD